MATPPKKPTDGIKAPAPRKPATPRKTTRKAGAATTPKRVAQKAAGAAPADTKPSTAAASRKPAVKRASTPTNATTGKRKKWGVAAVIGGLGAAVTAGVLALRGSTPADDEKPNLGRKAHQADGTDASKSFEAGIADEGTIPE